MRGAHRVAVAAALAFLVPACSGPKPLGPTPIDEGIVVYINAGFRGVSQQVGSDVTDLTRVEGPCTMDDAGHGTWNDCISSVRVLPGWGARLYGDKNFRGAMIEVSEDVADLSSPRGDCSGSYDDCVSSIRVFKR